MSNQGELRATSDLMLEMLDRLRAAEETKRSLRPGTREFADHAYNVLEMARFVTRWSELQLKQANESLTEAVPPVDSLEDTPKRRLDVVLAEWRQAELRLSQASPGSPELVDATESAERLREEYRRLQAAKMDRQPD
jgi:hypothetical protein